MHILYLYYIYFVALLILSEDRMPGKKTADQSVLKNWEEHDTSQYSASDD